MTGSYDGYIRSEWTMFHADASRARSVLDAVAGVDVDRVLDVGCGAGQELIPFVAGGAEGVGVDVAPEVGRGGRELFGAELPDARVEFARAAAENLPFEGQSFDVVVCRLALPYTDNSRALAEIARVLRPSGVLLLKIHHARYYAGKLRRAIGSRDLLSAVHAARVLAAGAIYQVTGRQVRSRWPSRETFQTRRLLRSELGRHGLAIRRELPDSTAETPSFLIGRPRLEPTVGGDEAAPRNAR